MSDPRPKSEIIHQRAVFAAGTLILATLVIVAFTQFTGGAKPYEPHPETLVSADLFFEDEADGVVAVYEAETGRRLIAYGENEGGFVRVVMRSVARKRRMIDEGPEIPVRLSRRGDGQLWLEDSVSGAQIYLGAFGPDNSGAFDEILLRGQEILSAQSQGTSQ
jgi:putative photosynthetic complex assembly protein